MMMTSAHTNSAFNLGPGVQDDNQSIASDLSTAAFKDSFKDDLLKAIESIRAPGAFAFNAVLDKLPPDLGISVNGVGRIPLPLNESHARRIISKAHRAPYGKGSDTIVDTTVRNTWEIDPTQFAITWSGWSSSLRNIRGVVAQQLGINTTVHADLYKMLLYEKGAMFKAHTDTEKIPGMFGTLVISLPSKHTGGEVVLKHSGEKVMYESSKFEVSCAGWYSDVSHEVRPVTSGYRWVLTYNLAIDQSLPTPSAGPQTSEQRAIRHSIRRWLAQDVASRDNQYVYYVLDHEYTEANTSYRSLKAVDLARVSALQQACNGLPVTLFLSLLEKEEMGEVEFDVGDLQYNYRGAMGEYDDESDGSYHHIAEVLQTTYRLKTVRDLEGNVVAGTMGIQEDDMLEPYIFDDMVGEEEYEGYMGNSGPSATHWYRLGAVVIVPHVSIADFFMQPEDSYSSRSNRFPQDSINYLARQCSQPAVQDYLITAMVDLFKKALPCVQGDPSRLTDNSVLSNVLQAALQHKEYQLVENTLIALNSTLPAEWYSSLRQWLIREGREDEIMERFNIIKKGLTLTMLSPGSFTSKLKVITHIVPTPNNMPPDALPTPEPILEWARQTLQKLLEDDVPRQVTKDDGPSVVDMALYFDDPVLFLTETVIPVFEKHHLAPAFRFRLLYQLAQLIEKEMLLVPEGQNLYRAMARLLIASQDFSLLRDAGVVAVQEHKKRLQTPWMPWLSRDRSHIPTEKYVAITYETLREFFTWVLKLSTEMDNLAAQFMSKVIMQADKLPPQELCMMWLSLLRSIVPDLERNNVPLDTPSYQKFVSTLIRAVIDKYLGPEPVKPANWRVNDFLAHPTQMSEKFPMNKNRRHHIHNRLDGDHVGCTHKSERNTNPHTLVITKTTRPQELKLQSWLKRLDQVVEQLSQFKAEHLATLLGPDIERVKQLGKRQKGQGNISQHPVVGEKRKADDAGEVIDLTSD
ncbi:hypothetical protein FHETE_9239 [Fusarium heterosporum]|uniref:Prolyl 4-hydroxylase alpha subunit Fe(2+) 2OG dioxygenase domain-containing protein n=1 Tax=Fusarium heterosporum TaxID=42747 RepID=A0A8H5WEV3_FUSHE|nr:hypothetical protein FHETE_9239 [Fusarium heterosporum]